MKVALTIKTNLTYDGRVLAQLHTLSSNYPNSVFKIFVLEDGPFKGILPKNIHYKKVKLISRFLPKTKAFQFIKLLEYGINIFFRLLFFKPDIIHVHDDGSVLGPVFYKQLFKKNILIYDDHELMYMDKGIPIYQKMMKSLEIRMFKLADQIIITNYERLEYAKAHISIINKKPITVIENYHFTKNNDDNKEFAFFEKVPGIKYLLHQGVIRKERGQGLLYEIIDKLPDDWKLIMIGIKQEAYNQFVNFNSSLKDKTVFGGYIPYDVLDKFWEQVDAAVIFYETDQINNRLCAPNRLYQAANLGIPVIVNDNPILKKFVEKHADGVTLNNDNSAVTVFFNNYPTLKSNAVNLKGHFDYSIQAKKLIKLYDSLVSKPESYSV